MKAILHLAAMLLLIASCSKEKEHTAAAVNPEDSVAVMTSYGVNTLISDSGVIRYRIVAERWEVNQALQPSRWIFDKGIFMEQFDQLFHIEAYIQADTAYYFDEMKLWELRGRVCVRTKDGLRFASEELYWDQKARVFYSNMFSRVITPEREMEGTYFLSDENMDHYTVTNSMGSFSQESKNSGNNADTILTAPDTTKAKLRTPTTPKAKSPVARQQ